MTDLGRPGYADRMDMRGMAARAAEGFARQVLLTAGPWLSKPLAEVDVLDVGCGYGYSTRVLAGECRSAVGVEPMPELAAEARSQGLDVRHCGVESLDDVSAFDLVVLDNVYEHLPDHRDALARIDRALRPGGVVYLLMPNRLWPLEVHYGLPFLSWLPLPLANRYLRASGRGVDYSDASFAPTFWGLRRGLARVGWSYTFTLPADPSATHLGTPWHYRVGMAALRRFPALWAVSKAFLVVAVKD